MSLLLAVVFPSWGTLKVNSLQQQDEDPESKRE